MKPRVFTLQEERYLIAQLNQPDDRVATKALQWVCERVRAGYFFADTRNIRATLRLCLHRTHPNARRWAVNALTEIGPGPDVDPILGLISLTADDPDLLAAIVPAIFSARPDEEAVQLLADKNVGMEGLALIAASQYSINQKRKLVETLVPLESADDACLRSAIVLTGTKKAPEHLFDKRHPNATALSELNLHDSSSVSKYSIWAQTQLNHGFGSLLLPDDRIESSSPEIRKWVYRLLIHDPRWMARKLDMISAIPNDPSVEVREEAAIGLRDAFTRGLDRIVSKWFLREVHGETRWLLLDHMAAQSDLSAIYVNIVREMYKAQTPHSDARNRIEAAAAKTLLFSALRRIAITEEGGLLFANDNELNEILRGGNVTNIHIHGGNIGAITGSGDINGETIAAIANVNNADTKEILGQVFEIVSLIQDPAAKADAQRTIQEAATKPSGSAWKKVLGILQGIKTGTLAMSATAGGVDQLIEKIGPLIG